MATLGTLIVNIVADTSRFQAGMRDVSTALSRSSQTMNAIGNTLTARVTLPIVAAGVAATKMSTDFNAAMANVASLIPGNTKRVEELKAAVQGMAVATGKSTGDLASGLYQVISAFGDTADTAKILEMNARAAAAGVASTTDAINLTSAVTKGYGDTSAAAVQKVSDLALLAVRLGQTTFPELAASIGRVVPLAKNLKVSQEELFAAMSALTGVTGNAAEVSTQLRGALQSLMAPTETMSELFQKLGVRSGEALIEQKGLHGAIQTVVASAEASGIPLQKLMGQIEGQTAALALAGPQAKDYAAKLREMQRAAGTTEAAFREQTEGVNKTGFALAKARQEVAVLAQRMGDVLAPAILMTVGHLKGLVGRLQDAVKWFTALDADTQARWLGLVLALAALGPMAKIIAGVTAAVRLLLPVLAGLAALLATPGGLIVLGIAAAAAGLVTLVTRWDDVTAAIRRNIEAQRGAAGGAFIPGTGGMRVPTEMLMSFATSEQLRAADIRQKALDPLAAIRFGQLDIAEQMWIDQAAPAAAAAETVRQVVDDLSGSTAKTITQFDILAARLKGLQAEWEIYSAQAGKAAEGAEGLIRQKTNLAAKLQIVRQQVGWLTAQYDQSVAKSGAFSEASLELADQLGQATVQGAQLEGAIRDVNVAMVEFSAPVLAAKARVEELTGTVASLSRSVAVFSEQLATNKEKLAATKDAVAAVEKTMGTSRAAIKSALGDMGTHIDFLKTKIGDMRAGLKAALSDMAAHVSDLASRLGDAKSALQALTSVRLTGQGAFEEQIAAFEQQERQLRLTMNALRMMGEQAPKAEVEAAQRQLEQLGLMRERITLEREIDVAPLQRELAKLTDTAKEVSFADAKEAIEKQQAEVARLSDEYVRAKRTLEELTAATADVVDELRHFSFADAQIAANAAAAAIRATTPEYAAAKQKLLEMQASIAGVMEEARKLSFDEAVTAIERHRKALEGDATKLEALLALQDAQTKAVADAQLALTLHSLALETHKTALAEASSALDALRDAARAAAAAMSGIGGVATRALPGPVPLPPSAGTVARGITSSAGTGQAAAASISSSGVLAAATAALQQIRAGQLGAAMDTLATQAGFGWEQAVRNVMEAAGAAGVGAGKPIKFAEGGIVPGPLGAPMPAIVHGGERVLTPGQQGGVTIQVRVEGPVYGLLDFDDRVRQAVRDGMRGGAFRGVIAKP